MMNKHHYGWIQGLVLGMLLLAFGLPLWGAPGGEVTVTHEDIDKDGVPEIVLSNGLLRLEIMTGVAPRPASPPSFFARLFGEKGEVQKPKYGTRFVGPGWMYNVVSLTTNRRWFVNDPTHGRHWHGIPEEFDQAVRMVETKPGVWKCLKIGVGVCRGTGWCTRGTLSLLDPGRWQTHVISLADDGKAVVFTQDVDTPYGYAYTYSKRIALRPGQTRFVVSRELRNRGSMPLETTWYSHAFWGQADAGNSYDEACWATIPIHSLRPDANLGSSTDPCVVSNHPPGNYWGAIDGAAIGGNWYACGHRKVGDIFLTAFSRQPDFYRVWTYASTYSCEPFQVIDLAPGQTFSWEDLRACGKGMPRVDGHDGWAAYALGARQASADRPGDIEALLRLCPFESFSKGTVTIRVHGKAGGVETLSHPLTSCAAGEMIDIPLKRAPGTFVSVDASLSIFGRAAADNPFGEHATGMRLPVTWPAAILPRAPANAHAVLFAALPRQPDGALKPNRAVGFLFDYLLKAGFSVSLAHPRENWDSVDWNHVDLVVFAGLGSMSREQVRTLEENVSAGMGLFVTGPLDLRSFEFSSLLPATHVLASVEEDEGPRDCTREFLGASKRRYHLQKQSDHPILQGLPLFPDAYQDIGRLQVVTARPEATEVLRYYSPKEILPQVTAPALLVNTYGQGRVALLTCPVDWGLPPSWCLWGGIGEYHRKFLAQTATWACRRKP